MSSSAASTLSALPVADLRQLAASIDVNVSSLPNGRISAAPDADVVRVVADYFAAQGVSAPATPAEVAQFIVNAAVKRAQPVPDTFPRVAVAGSSSAGSQQLFVFDLEDTLFHSSSRLTVTGAQGGAAADLRLVQTVFVAGAFTFTVAQYFQTTGVASSVDTLIRTVVIREETNSGVVEKRQVRVPSADQLSLVLVRPGVVELLQTVVFTPGAVVGVYTAATRAYAVALLGELVQGGVSPSSFQFVLTRRQCFRVQAPSEHPKVEQARLVKPLTRAFAAAAAVGTFNAGNSILIDNNVEAGDQFPNNVLPVDNFALTLLAEEASASDRSTIAGLAEAAGSVAQAAAIRDAANTPFLGAIASDVVVGGGSVSLIQAALAKLAAVNAATSSAYDVPALTQADLADE